MEYARPLLTTPGRREEAFDMLRRGVKFSSFMWGRRYTDNCYDTPGGLFYKLGYRFPKYESIGIFGKAALSGSLMSLLFGTLNKEGRVYANDQYDARAVMRWTYESIFFDSVPLNLIPPIRFPAQMGKCPPRNEDNTREVWSGGQIPVTGIWEPWAIDPNIGVRCPNYYLAGDTASRYQFEGTETFENVRWRLLWKDNRYVNGEIPAEEADYFGSQPTRIVAPVTRASYSGETCPQSGKWYSNHLNKTVYLQAGDVMPGPQYSPSGNLVAWYLRDA
jgi:hypothetical protein